MGLPQVEDRKNPAVTTTYGVGAATVYAPQKGADKEMVKILDENLRHLSGVMGIAKRAKLKNIPVTAIAGSIEGGVEEAYRSGLGAIFSINQKAEDFSASRYHSKENLKATVKFGDGGWSFNYRPQRFNLRPQISILIICRLSVKIR